VLVLVNFCHVLLCIIQEAFSKNIAMQKEMMDIKSMPKYIFKFIFHEFCHPNYVKVSTAFIMKTF
jgi:hypothetical protein